MFEVLGIGDFVAEIGENCLHGSVLLFASPRMDLELLTVQYTIR